MVIEWTRPHRNHSHNKIWWQRKQPLFYYSPPHSDEMYPRVGCACTLYVRNWFATQSNGITASSRFRIHFISWINCGSLIRTKHQMNTSQDNWITWLGNGVCVCVCVAETAVSHSQFALLCDKFSESTAKNKCFVNLTKAEHGCEDMCDGGKRIKYFCHPWRWRSICCVDRRL